MERAVLGLLFILLLVGVTLAVLLWVGTVFLQGYFYTEPNADAYWQGPAAGAAVMLFLLAWCVLNLSAEYGAQVPYDTLFRFSATEEMDSVPATKIWAVKKGVKDPIEFDRHRLDQTRYEYINPGTNERWRFLGVEAIVLQPREGEKMRFDRDKDAVSGSKEFISADGWGMGENNLGRPSIFRSGRFVMNLLLNGLHFALWFVCLWLLLRFQWSHALGLAFIMWLAMTVTVVPMLMIRCGEVAQEGATAAGARSAGKAFLARAAVSWGARE
jgi:hypothetical protein